MFPVSEANFFFVKKYRIFETQRPLKQQRLLFRIFGGAALVAAGGIRPRHYDANGGGGGDRRRRKI